MDRLHASQEAILSEFLADPRTRNLRVTDPQMMSVHIAVLVKRGKILAQATNRNGSRSSGSGYSDRSIHAERNVVKQLGDITKLRGADMYIMRISRDFTHRVGFDRYINSTPCRDCQLFLEKCIREYGLKNVYYTAKTSPAYKMPPKRELKRRAWAAAAGTVAESTHH